MLCLALAACTRTPAPPSTQSATPVATVRPERSSPALPQTSGTSAPALVASPSPAAPSPAAPATSASRAAATSAVIYSVRVTPTAVHSGDTVVWNVRTSASVVRVTARTTVVSLPLSRVSPGHFALTFGVPSRVPFFFHHAYDLDVEADAADGSSAHRSVTLTFL